MGITQSAVLTILQHSWLDPPIPGDINESQTATTKLILYSSAKFNDTALLQGLLMTEIVRYIIAEPNITDLPEKYQIYRNLTRNSYDKPTPPSSAFRFFTHAENAVIFLSPRPMPMLDLNTIQINSNYKGFRIRGRMQFPYNLNPQRVHYIFFGSNQDVREVFELGRIQVLRYKTGIIVERNATPVQILEERFIQGSRESELVELFNPGDFGKSNDDKFNVIRHRHLIIESFPTKLHVQYDKAGHPVAGLTYNIARSQCGYFNCSFDYKLEGYKSIGQNPDGSWNGFTGDLMEHRADIIMWLGQSFTRYPYLDWTPQVQHMTFGLLTPIPRATVRWQAILGLFDLEVWLCIGISCLAVIPMLYVCFKLQNRDPFEATQSSPIYHAITGPFIIFLRGSAVLPRKGLLMSAMLLFSFIVIGTFLDSSLISFLTFPQPGVVPQAMDELMDMPQYNISYIRNIGSLSDRVLHEYSRASSLTARLSNYTPPQGAIPIGMTALECKTVTLDYQIQGIILAAENFTLLPGMYPVRTGQSLFGTYAIVALRKYSKLTDIVVRNVGAMGSAGLLEKWKYDSLEAVRLTGSSWLKKAKPEVYGSLKKNAFDILYPPVKPFTLRRFIYAFLCWICGCGCALVCRIIAIAVRRFTMYKEDKVGELTSDN